MNLIPVLDKPGESSGKICYVSEDDVAAIQPSNDSDDVSILLLRVGAYYTVPCSPLGLANWLLSYHYAQPLDTAPWSKKEK
jgi:hypothetical protein